MDRVQDEASWKGEAMEILFWKKVMIPRLGMVKNVKCL